MRSNYFKFFTVLVLDLIQSNPTKYICIILSIITWQFAGSYEDAKYQVKVDKQIEIAGTHLYISSDLNDSKEIKYEMKQFEDKQELIDGNLVWYEYSGWNVFFWVIFVISTLIWSISTIVGWVGSDDEAGWELEESIKEAISSIIYCEEENGIYYYISLGRLIGKRDQQVRRGNVRYEFGINSLRDVLFCPKFQTKTQKRENLLEEIGIK